MATTCYCEMCHAQGRAPEVRHTYTRAFLKECNTRGARAAAEKEVELERKRLKRQESKLPPAMDEGWWNQEGAPTA